MLDLSPTAGLPSALILQLLFWAGAPSQPRHKPVVFSFGGLSIAGEGEGARAENTVLGKAQVFPECFRLGFRCSGRFRETRKIVPVRRLPKD